MTSTPSTQLQSRINCFVELNDSIKFLSNLNDFIQFLVRELEDSKSIIRDEIKNWKVSLFNEERHVLFPHQVMAIRGCIDSVVLSDQLHSGFCFMPTSAGKGHILMTLAGLAVGNFAVHRHVAETVPDVWKNHSELFPIITSLGLIYSMKVTKPSVPRTQILVHDKEILKQLADDCEKLLGTDLFTKIEFHSVQALKNSTRREQLRYVIIDEAHWGNATEEETIQSRLINELKANGGKAFGFTASPYPGGKFQTTWSENKLNGDLDFNYYLDRNILYPVVLREVNLQNARADYTDGADETDLKEREQVIEYMANHVAATLPVSGLDGPAICFFSSIIIPDMVEAIGKVRPDLKNSIKVLASEQAFFATKCVELFGPQILATPEDIVALKRGEKIFLISRQKLLVGLNAPYLRYCFISPTNSKITIMQAIGRLMRPIAFEKVPRKLATLFLTSLSGKKLDISGGGSEPKESEEEKPRPGSPFEENDDPKTRYTTTSMTLSEAYDLPIPVFYKTEVGFRDFINQTRVNDANSVERVKSRVIDPEELEKFDPIAARDELNRLRNMARSQYKQNIVDRDSRFENGRKIWFCQGKKVLKAGGCCRGFNQVELEIHHMEPHTVRNLISKLGPEGFLAWHADIKNYEYLVTLCEECHHKIHLQDVA